MSPDLPADPDAEPTPVETSTLLIYLRGGQTIRHEVTDWTMTLSGNGQDITELRATSRRPGEGIPQIRLSAVDAVVVMPTAQT